MPSQDECELSLGLLGVLFDPSLHLPLRLAGSQLLLVQRLGLLSHQDDLGGRGHGGLCVGGRGGGVMEDSV